jgi:dTDP-6-deoxy-L-talose 4-dehydrogenase (NAD+)
MTTTQSRQVIVSGATGFIGRHIVPLLLKKDYDVVALCRNKDRAKTLSWYQNVEFIFSDFHNENLPFQPETGASLIHLAWNGLPNYKSNFHFEENLPQSYAFIKGLIQQGVHHVIVAGTCFEYGMKDGALSPDSPTEPTNPYGYAKDCLRQQLQYLQNDLDFKLQWARFFYLFGEGQNPQSILAQLDTAIDRGDTSFKMSGGEQLRDYLNVESAAQKFVELFHNTGEGTYNICNGRPISIRTLVENHLRKRNADMELELGFYPYPDYEPMAFWGEDSQCWK